MWGTGEKVFDIVPSRYVEELTDPQDVQPFYDYATAQTLYHMNHPDAGYMNALKPYAYDQISFGTSGIGGFPNKAFVMGRAENALLFRNFGIDNVVIDEGKGGACDYVFATYRWRVSRIVGEFCTDNGAISQKALATMPKEIRDAWRSRDFNKEFTLVFGMMPRDDYDPKLKGKRGMRYRGVWFMDSSKDNKFFMEEDFAERPIGIARMIRVRGEVWGRSSGTMLVSTIKAENFILGTAIEIIEKMSNPSLGIMSNALFGDSALDSSPNGLTVFNQSFAGPGSAPPVFPLYDVGNPSAMVEFLIPYMNEKIATAFKVDSLLDFSTAKEMTATESMQRYVIRGKSLSGILTQQKNERLIPDVRRSISILYGMGELGVNPETNSERASELQKLGKQDRIIPQAVLKVIDSGRPWYELRFNNELEKLTRTESLQNLVQLLQTIGGIAAVYPQIIEAVDWYKLLLDINKNLDANNQLLYTEKQFKATIKELADQRQMAMAAQVAQVGATAARDASQAQKNNAQAANGGK